MRHSIASRFYVLILMPFLLAVSGCGNRVPYPQDWSSIADYSKERECPNLNGNYNLERAEIFYDSGGSTHDRALGAVFEAFYGVTGIEHRGKEVQTLYADRLVIDYPSSCKKLSIQLFSKGHLLNSQSFEPPAYTTSKIVLKDKSREDRTSFRLIDKLTFADDDFVEFVLHKSEDGAIILEKKSRTFGIFIFIPYYYSDRPYFVRVPQMIEKRISN